MRICKCADVKTNRDEYKFQLVRTDPKTEKTVVEQLREIQDKVSLDIKDLSFEALKEYINKQKTLHPSDVWKKMSEPKVTDQGNSCFRIA